MEPVDSVQPLREAAAPGAALEAVEPPTPVKASFMARVSHELRTPMNGVLGLSALLMEEDLSPSAQACAETIHRCASSLLGLLNDVLDVSKIHAGTLPLDPVDFDLRRTVREVIDTLAPTAMEKGLELSVEVDESLPSCVLGAESRLRQVLTNLVGNGLKFTTEGRVHLQVDGAELGPPLRIRFAVQDTGLGIPQQAQEAIFEPFVQVDSSTSRRFGGAGLGLSICRHLVGQMEGTLAVRSTLGEGSTFHFHVPLPEVRRCTIPCSAGRCLPAVPRGHRSLHVLVVDDHRVNQVITSRFAQKLGHRVTTANDGREAVEQVAAAKFDVVLMDLQMPGMDGIEATRAIRSLPQGQVPIVAVSGNVTAGDRLACAQAGMDGFLAKPLRAEELKRTLSRWSLEVCP